MRQVVPAGTHPDNGRPGGCRSLPVAVARRAWTSARSVGTAISSLAFDGPRWRWDARWRRRPISRASRSSSMLGANGSVDKPPRPTAAAPAATRSPGSVRGPVACVRRRTAGPDPRPPPTRLDASVVPPGASGVDFGSRRIRHQPAVDCILPTAIPAGHDKGRAPEDEPDKLTQEQRQQRERTNTANLDEYRTEGHVVAIEQTQRGHTAGDDRPDPRRESWSSRWPARTRGAGTSLSGTFRLVTIWRPRAGKAAKRSRVDSSPRTSPSVRNGRRLR